MERCKIFILALLLCTTIARAQYNQMNDIPYREAAERLRCYAVPGLQNSEGPYPQDYRQLTARFLNGCIIASQCGKGRKLGCTVPHRHPWMMLWLVMWQIDDIVVIVGHALCPPICSLRSLAVAPSSKFRPRRMAFLPKRFLIFNCASCILRSLLSLACSS